MVQLAVEVVDLHAVQLDDAPVVKSGTPRSVASKLNFGAVANGEKNSPCNDDNNPTDNTAVDRFSVKMPRATTSCPRATPQIWSLTRAATGL